MLKYLVCVIFVLLSAAALADEMLDKTKQTYDFEKWPGKDGALKQGVCMKEVDLSSYEVMSVRSRLFTSGGTILRYRVKGAKKPAFEIAVKVLDTVGEAHEELVRFLSGCTMKVPRGDTVGLQAGDVCFAAKDKDVLKAAVFVRNNVFVRVSAMPAPANSDVKASPDVAQIAKKIDTQVKQEEEAQKPQDLNKPVISEFSVLSAAGESVKADTPVEVSFKVSDPEGEKMQVHFDEGGGMVYEYEGKRYFKAEKPGKYTVTAYVINEHFLVSRKSVVIQVEE